MAKHWTERWKPAASRRTHLLAASIMWTVVGTLLFYFGARWVVRSGTGYAYVQIAAAALVGGAKAWFVLRKAAKRIVERIRDLGNGRCLGGFVSWKTWLLILGMMTMGRVLRGGLLSRHIVGLLYAGIGVALVVGSWSFWRAWHEERGGSLPTPAE